MKQKTLYYILVACLVVISILLTMLFMSNNNNSNGLDKMQYNNKQYIDNSRNKHNYPEKRYGGDIDYAYDYDGYWFQPSRPT